MRVKYFILIICIFLCINVSAQHPFSTKWVSVKTPHAKIICDRDINSHDLNRVAGSFEQFLKADENSLPANPRRIPIVMSSSALTTNGYVTLFPYKMYWYSLPSNNNSIGIGEWYQNLAVHETRHMVQFQATNHGFTKLSGIFMGAYGRSAMRMSVPNWWFEGDAVYAETILTTCGRGRLSSFELLTASILDSRSKNYPYDKMVNGSYRNHLPNHYELGYHLVTHGRRIAGVDVWSKTVRRSSWYTFWPWAFGSSFKHFSGVNLTNNYKQTMNELRNFYSQRINSLHITNATTITQKHNRRYESYSYPRFINDTTFVALKYTLTEPNKMVSVTLSGKEKELFKTDATSYDIAKGKMIWATSVPDERWTLRSFSDIAIYDFDTHCRYRLTHRGRYFSPAISPDAKMIAAVEFDKSRKVSLCIFKAERIGKRISSLQKIKQIDLQSGEYLRSLKFLSNNELAAVSNYHNQNAVVIFDIVSGTSREVKPYADEAINTICPAGNVIYYDSDFSGITNIWALDIASGNCNMITSRKYSASQPDLSPDGHTFIYSDFLSTGANIVSATIVDNGGVSQSDVKPCKLEYFKPLEKYEPAKSLDLTSVSTGGDIPQFKVKKYLPFYDLIRVYGWMPDFSSGTMGGTIYSQNTLETFSLYLNKTYHIRADYWRTTVGATYSGFYPVLGLSASFSDDAEKYYFRNNRGQLYQQYVYWKTKIVNASVSFPFNFSRFNYSQKLNIEAQISHYDVSNKITESYYQVGNGNFNVIHSTLNYSLGRAVAHRDFKATLGFSLKLDAMKTVGYSRQASKFKSVVSATVPGLFRQNSLTVTSTFMRQIRNYNINKIYLFADTDAEVRGYYATRCHEMTKLSGEYAFPLGYPDVGIPAIVWVKRIRGSIFGDAAESDVFGEWYQYGSAGFSLVGDIHILRIPNMVSLGFSFAKPLITNMFSKNEFRFLLTYQM